MIVRHGDRHRDDRHRDDRHHGDRHRDDKNRKHKEKKIIKREGEKDKHGCLISAGESYCASQGKCIGPGQPCGGIKPKKKKHHRQRQ